jgi:hypothetical protein
VPRELLVDGNDIYDGNLSVVYDEVVPSIDQVDESVRRAGADPEDLGAPWKCDFPL